MHGHSFDFVAAYLNSPIEEEIWVIPPDGMNVPAGYALLLQKELYGKKQASRCWWLYLKRVLVDLNFFASQYDNCLYLLKHQDTVGVIWIHVDNVVVTASSEVFLKKLESALKGLFQIKHGYSAY